MLLMVSKPNILIDVDGHARVSDFGLASIAYGKYTTGPSSDKGHTVRWSAPEVLSGAIPASKQADIFAFGMVVVEVRTVFVKIATGYHVLGR
jgi:serine/threonine protein kinase